MVVLGIWKSQVILKGILLVVAVVFIIGVYFNCRYTKRQKSWGIGDRHRCLSRVVHAGETGGYYCMPLTSSPWKLKNLLPTGYKIIGCEELNLHLVFNAR